MSKKKNLIITCSLLMVSLIVTILLGIFFRSFSTYQTRFDKSRVSETHTLVEFSPNLKGTVGGTTEIFMIYDKTYYTEEKLDVNGNIKIEEAVKAPSLLVMGGTHPNEPSGQLTATVILENAKVSGSTILFVITETNKSAFTHSHPQEASPLYYTIKTADGTSRTFKFGSRATNTNEQWPNPDVYTGLAGQKLSSNDARNLNRSYPGKVDGTYSERVAYGITEMIKLYDIKMTIDLHEASPEYKTINAIITCNNAAGVSANAKDFYLDAFGDFDDPINVDIAQESGIRGLTHVELGAHTNTLCVIAETSNSAQGKIRGSFTTDIILDGSVDKFYTKALEVSNQRVAEGKDGIIYGNPTSLDVRVGRHLTTIAAMICSYNECVEGMSSFNLKKTYNEVSVEDRQTYLSTCGSLEINFELSQRVAGELDYDSSLYDISGIYNALKINGVGAFISNDSDCE